VLLIVLIAVCVLSLSAYAFSEFMLAEAKASAMYARGAQARVLAESAIETVAALLEQPVRPSNLYDNPDLLLRVLVADGPRPAERGRFSILAPRQTGRAAGVRFGLVDESSMLNLNALPLERRYRHRARAMLLGLPEMTPQVADAILDWLDADDSVRDLGAESSYYSTLTPPYTTKNGPIQTLDELLLVRGVTRRLLYGEDANRNGWLDAGEDDDADGRLDAGWSQFLTVYGRESNLRPNGPPKIDLNQPSLVRLYDALEPVVGRTAAQFIVALRQNGTPEMEQLVAEELSQLEMTEQEKADAAARRAKAQRGELEPDPRRSRQDETDDPTRAGIDLSIAPAFQITSLFALFGSSVRVRVDGQDTVLDSPWPADPRKIQTVLPDLWDKLTVSPGSAIEGRVNVNHAPYEVLRGLPHMTADLARAIAAAQQTTTGQSMADRLVTRRTPAWLLYEGLTDLKRLQRVAPYLTARGDVYRMWAVAQFDAGGASARIEAVVDATSRPAQVVFLRDLAPTEAHSWKNAVEPENR
jgi:type II secretory pathway component PulK